ncbi:MAG: flagellar basal body-associated FliL family protein [Gammaproteobacteria bacterium]
MAENKPAEGEKKSTKKILLLVLVPLIFLGGGAAGYYFFFVKPADAQLDEGTKGQRSPDKGSESQDKPNEADSETYYNLEAPLIVNFPPGSSARIVKISISVLLTDQVSVEMLKKHEPMIRNNLLMVISSMGADQMKTFEGKQALRTMMLTEIGKVMEKMSGKNTVKDVFFTEFVMQ